MKSRLKEKVRLVPIQSHNVPLRDFLSNQLQKISPSLSAQITLIRISKTILMQSIGKPPLKKFRRWKDKNSKHISSYNLSESE